MKPKLILQPFHTSTADLLKCFASGKPLSCDQINFVARYQKQLSSAGFDPVYKYYVDSAIKKHKHSASFLLSSDELDADRIN